MNKFGIFLVATFCTATHAEFISPDRSTSLQFMADVARTEILDLPNQSARLFSYTGGDPAMNGLLLHVAVFNDATYKWNIYPLKNVAEYRLLASAQTGYLKLEITTDDLDESGWIQQIKSTMFINLSQAHQPNGKVEIKGVRN